MSAPALLVAGHGTRDAEGQAATVALLDRLRALRPGLTVAAGFVDNEDPALGGSLDELAADHRAVAVVPLLLTGASHAKTDVPGSIQAARLRHPGLRIGYGRPLGPHPLLLDALRARLDEAGVHRGEADTAVVLAAAGSVDPDANADIARTARLLLEGSGWRTVEPAFASATTPDIAEAVRRARAIGAAKVVVATYVLAPGAFARRIATAARDAGADAVTGPLLPDAGLSQLVLERYAEAVNGDTRMSCDTCLHRVPFPGRESALGAPQQPHAHPSETGKVPA